MREVLVYNRPLIATDLEFLRRSQRAIVALQAVPALAALLCDEPKEVERFGYDYFMAQMKTRQLQLETADK